MPIEPFDYTGNLVPSNPVATDPEGEGDDHIRGIKAALKNTFPNLTAAVTATAAQLNQLATGIFTFTAGSSGSPSVIIGDAASAFYRVSSGIIGIVGRLSGNGAVDAGAMYYFPKTAPGGMASGGTATGSERYALCDGATYNISTFPALGAYLGSTYGGDGVNTFGMPNVANRFLRGAGGSIAVGVTQANAVKSHVHGVGIPAHDHTGLTDNHHHSIPATTAATILQGNISNNGGTVTVLTTPSGSTNTGDTQAHFTTDSGGGAAVSSDATGDTETRPDAFAAYVCLKT